MASAKLSEGPACPPAHPPTTLASLYAKYYFELRTLREGEPFPLQPLKHEQLRRLEARSAAFNAEVLSAREKEKALDRGARTLGSLKSGF